MDDKIKEVIIAYREYTKNTQDILRELEYPETSIMAETMNIPNLGKMLPEDISKLFLEIKTVTILTLHGMGFSAREIEKRIGGGSYNAVHRIVTSFTDKVEASTPEDVTN